MLRLKRVSLRTIVPTTVAGVVLLGAILAWRRVPLLLVGLAFRVWAIQPGRRVWHQAHAGAIPLGGAGSGDLTETGNQTARWLPCSGKPVAGRAAADLARLVPSRVGLAQG
jgi:hypothetical protein